jgi:hypothetical protein
MTRVSSSPPGHDYHAENDDASVFETAADFFSLLSLAIVYMAVIFGLAGGSGELVSVERLSAGGSGTTVPFDPTTAFVGFLPRESGMLVRLQTPGGEVVVEREWPITEDGEMASIEWVVATLGDDRKIEKVVCFVSQDEDRGEVHRAFHRLISRLREQYRVSMRS